MKIMRESELRGIIRTEIERSKVEDEINSLRSKAKKTLLEQAKLLEDFNKHKIVCGDDLRKNTDALIQIYSYVLNL